jgi:hypothetical protein
MVTAVPESAYDTPDLLRVDKKLSLAVSAYAVAGAALAAATMPTEMANAVEAFAEKSSRPGMTVMGPAFLLDHETESLL